MYVVFLGCDERGVIWNGGYAGGYFEEKQEMCRTFGMMQEKGFAWRWNYVEVVGRRDTCIEE